MNLNSGALVLNAAPADEHASVLVAGLGRSGTTMVSRVLTALGLFMGDHVSRGTNEDKEFRKAVRAESLAEFERLCQDRDSRFDRWGFKAPAARNKLPDLVQVMRSPRVILTSRDPLTTAIRVAAETNAEVLPILAQTLRKTGTLLRTVQKLDCPVLLLSYEKALTRPHDIVALIAEFCGVGADESTLERAAKTIRNGDPTYLGLA